MYVELARENSFQQIANIVESLRAQTDFKLEQFNWNSESILSELASAQTLIVQDEQKIVSFLCYRESADAIEITVLATKPGRQKQGWQSLLLEDLKKHQVSVHKPILLEVHAKNTRAQSLYKNRGFLEVARRKNYYRDGSEALVLQLQS